MKTLNPSITVNALSIISDNWLIGIGFIFFRFIINKHVENHSLNSDFSPKVLSRITYRYVIGYEKREVIYLTTVFQWSDRCENFPTTGKHDETISYVEPFDNWDCCPLIETDSVNNCVS